jgi:single-strand DNA-binding protein
MASINKAIVVGYLGADPDIRATNNGTSVGTLSVATTDVWTAKDGNKVENTEWHRVTVWAQLAEFASNYLRKGSLVYVEGKLETRKYTDKDGVEKYTTEIKAMTLQGLDRKGNDQDKVGSATPPRGSEPKVPVISDNFNDMDDNLPF